MASVVFGQVNGKTNLTVLHSQDNLLFSASVACLFRSVTSVLICEGPTQLLPLQMNRRLKPKHQSVKLNILISYLQISDQQV